MLTICQGPYSETLADHLLGVLSSNPLKNPLAPEIFVVQNHGMARWISLYMARKEGIAANLKFEFPAERMWSLARVMDESIPQTLPSDREPLTWSLIYVLDRYSGAPEVEVLRRYVEEEKNPETRMMRSWKLCRRIADVFDQYLVYRPELLEKWEQGKTNTPDRTEQWQSFLWKKLNEHWRTTADYTTWLHRAELQKDLINAIDSGKLDAGSVPSRISIFGVSSMPPVYIQTLVKLSKLSDVYFYLISITAKKKSPLEESLGKEGETYLHYIKKYIEENPEVKKNAEHFMLPGTIPQKETLLRSVKQDIFNGSGNVPERRGGWSTADYSIQVHSCHSPMREVEVLYDQLLALLDEDDTLSPGDVLIMTPDMETYAPVIDAVFGAVEEGMPAIPYSIADRGTSISDPAAETFIHLLKISESRFKVTDVLDLLDREPVKNAFELNDEDISRLERWIGDTRIRWGIDGSFRESLGLPTSKRFTWKSGLERMLAGYMMKPVDDQLFHGIYPYDEIENSEDAALTGSFTNFMEALFELHKEINTPRTLKEWSSFLKNCAEQFLPDAEDYLWGLTIIRDHLDKLAKYEILSGFEQRVFFRVVRSWLEENLQKPSSGGGRTGRGVTFSSLIPMRNIPYRIIGLIGMNEGAFPRSKLPLEFDLMHKFPERGDRDRSEDDRYLFLESLVAVRQALYFSFIGQSNRQDSDFPPSVVLREFLEYLEHSCGVSSEKLVTKHRLQAFSPHYFQPNHTEWQLFSYSKTQKKIASQLLAPLPEEHLSFLPSRLPDLDNNQEWKKLAISDLIHFFQHPSRFLMENRLGLYLREIRVLTEDREPFGLRGLEGYQLGQDLLERYLTGSDPDAFKKVAEAQNMLPEGLPGNQAFDSKAAEVREFGSALRDMLDEEPLDDLEVEADIDDFRLVGRLDHIYTTSRMDYRFGKRRPKDLIDLWIKHLCFQLIKPPGHPGFSCLLTRGQKLDVEVSTLSPVPDASDLIGDLLRGYEQGLHEAYPFFPESSYAYAHEKNKSDKTHEQSLRKAASQWKSDYGSYLKEGDDPYNKRMFEGYNPLEQKEFADLAMQFWRPLFNALNNGEE